MYVYIVVWCAFPAALMVILTCCCTIVIVHSLNGMLCGLAVVMDGAELDAVFDGGAPRLSPAWAANPVNPQESHLVGGYMLDVFMLAMGIEDPVACTKALLAGLWHNMHEQDLGVLAYGKCMVLKDTSLHFTLHPNPELGQHGALHLHQSLDYTQLAINVWDGPREHRLFMKMSVHRLIHVLVQGPPQLHDFTDSDHVHHLCGQKCCCNPSHLQYMDALQHLGESARRKRRQPTEPREREPSTGRWRRAREPSPIPASEVEAGGAGIARKRYCAAADLRMGDRDTVQVAGTIGEAVRMLAGIMPPVYTR
jgi:hypothetical protein